VDAECRLATAFQETAGSHFEPPHWQLQQVLSQQLLRRDRRVTTVVISGGDVQHWAWACCSAAALW
jgi:hypothetical protein